MIRLSPAFFAIFLPTTLIAADAPLTPDAFEAATTGRTFYYSLGSELYGVEQYLPGRKVIWAFTGDDCRKGEWFPNAGAICFVYEDNPDPQCWSFTQTPEGLSAHIVGDTENPPLVAHQSSPAPMKCLGPDVGV